MRRSFLRTIATAALLAPVASWAEDAICGSDSQCAPWEVCTTSVGECGSALAPADVCTGTCQAGRRTRFVIRAHGATAPQITPFAGALGVEVVPPFAAGLLSIEVEAWTARLFRVGPTIAVRVTEGLALSVRADACLASGRWLACPGARVEYFPWWQFRWLTPAHYVSLTVEGAAVVGEAGRSVQVQPALLFGVGLWL